MIQEISICNKNDLIPWSIDLELIKEKHPSFYKSHGNNIEGMEYWEIEEHLNDKEENLDKMTKPIKSVDLFFSDGSNYSIYNIDLLSWHGLNYDGFYIYHDSNFVYFIISIVGFQAGSLGIWSIKERKWIFTRSDECFCVEAVIHSKLHDIFIGYSLWDYPYSPSGGDYFFIIKPDGRFSEVELKEFQDSDYRETSKNISRKSSSYDNHYLSFDEKKSVIVLIKGEKKSLYNLNLSNEF